MICICVSHTKDSSWFCTAHLASWSGHYIYLQQHLQWEKNISSARGYTRRLTYLPSYQCQWMQPNQCQGCEIISKWSERDTHHHTGSIPYLFNIRVMSWSNMKTRKKQPVLAVRQILWRNAIYCRIKDKDLHNYSYRVIIIILQVFFSWICLTEIHYQLIWM